MFLLDVNVWLALAFDRHLHHQPATDWFTSAAEDSCCFCRTTQMSFLRLATTPQVMTTDVLTLAEAWQAFDNLYNDPRVAFAEESQGIEPLWRGNTQHQSFSPKVWNDACLAAFARAADFDLVTFDKVFSQYKNLRLNILT